MLSIPQPSPSLPPAPCSRRTFSPRCRTGERILPRQFAVNVQRILQQTALHLAGQFLNLHHPDLAVPVWQILDGDVLVVNLLEGPEGQVEHTQRSDGELVRPGLRSAVVDDVIIRGVIFIGGPRVFDFIRVLRYAAAGGRSHVDDGRGKTDCRELVPVAREDYDTHTEITLGGLHGPEDLSAFVRETAPGVGGAEAPILGEGDGGRDDLPVDVPGFGGREEFEERG